MGRLVDSLLPATTIYRAAVWGVCDSGRDERLAVGCIVDSGGGMTINMRRAVWSWSALWVLAVIVANLSIASIVTDIIPPAFLALLGLCVGGGVSSYGFYRLMDGRDGIVTYLYWIGGAASCLLIGWVSADLIGLLLLS